MEKNIIYENRAGVNDNNTATTMNGASDEYFDSIEEQERYGSAATEEFCNTPSSIFVGCWGASRGGGRGCKPIKNEPDIVKAAAGYACE